MVVGESDDSGRELQREVAGLERRHGGRLGVAILDTAGVSVIAHRGDERFALCSTFKFLAAAFVLARVDRKQESLTRGIVYARDCLVPNSPVTEKHAGESGLTVGEICEAAMTRSD
ncbi:MAG TPA: serine hydrolase, partial [Candidatus Sulfotelmatobacter sp.]|nr:serine hydrolase [Candidatus Sulfotelmatobacter sp.]